MFNNCILDQTFRIKMFVRFNKLQDHFQIMTSLQTRSIDSCQSLSKSEPKLNVSKEVQCSSPVCKLANSVQHLKII